MSLKRNLLLSFFAVFCVLLIHLLAPSMLNGNQWLGTASFEKSLEYISKVTDLHAFTPPFNRRIFTSKAVLFVDSFLQNGLLSFILVQFLFLFLSSVTLIALSKKLGSTAKQSTLALGVYFLLFPLVFAFFPSNYCYDEPLQYLTLFLAIYSVRNKNYLMFFGCLLISLFVRETTLLLIPGFIILSRDKREAFILLGSATLACLFYKFSMAPSVVEGRFAHWQYNFQSARFTTETVINALIGLGPLGLLSFLAASRHWNDRSPTGSLSFNQRLTLAFVACFLITAPIVILATKAREIRIYCLPLVFLWPIGGILLKTYFRKYFLVTLKHKWLYILLFIATYFIYQPTDAPFGEGFRFVGALTLTSMLIVFMNRSSKKALA